MAFFSRKKEEPKKEEPKSSPAPVNPVKEKKAAAKEIGKTLGVIVKPLITEKASYLSPYGQYVFEVAPRANKIEIAKAVEAAYGVKPISVNVIHVRGKNVRYGKTSGTTKNRKKAIVTLKPGDKIEVYEGV